MTSKQNEEQSSIAARLRAWLEMAASVSVIVVASVLVWTLLSRGRSALVPAAGPPQGGPSVNQPVPEEPLSLELTQTEGYPTAKVVLLEFSDFQCPFCGQFARGTLMSLRREYVDTGKVLLAFAHMPLATIHPYAMKAADAAECAGEQGRFWAMHDRMFADQAKLDVASLKTSAQLLHLDTAAFDRCLSNSAAHRVQANAKEAARLGVSGTPTFFVGTLISAGQVKVLQRFSGALPLDRFRAVLEPLIAKGT